MLKIHNFFIGFILLKISLAANWYLVFGAPKGLSYRTLSSTISLSSRFLPPTRCTATVQENVIPSVRSNMERYF